MCKEQDQPILCLWSLHPGEDSGVEWGYHVRKRLPFHPVHSRGWASFPPQPLLEEQVEPWVLSDLCPRTEAQRPPPEPAPPDLLRMSADPISSERLETTRQSGRSAPPRLVANPRPLWGSLRGQLPATCFLPPEPQGKYYLLGRWGLSPR